MSFPHGYNHLCSFQLETKAGQSDRQQPCSTDMLNFIPSFVFYTNSFCSMDLLWRQGRIPTSSRAQKASWFGQWFKYAYGRDAPIHARRGRSLWEARPARPVLPVSLHAGRDIQPASTCATLIPYHSTKCSMKTSISEEGRLCCRKETWLAVPQKCGEPSEFQGKKT